MNTLAETYPSRVRIVVDEDSGQNQRGLMWSIRGKHYDSAPTAQSAYEAEALQTLDSAAKAAKAGASGGTVVTHGTISTNWTPVVGGRIGGTSYPTHTGTNRFYARVFSSSGTAVDARLVYDVGDLVNPVENNPVTLYDGGTFHVLDLGEARLDPPPTGTHRWDWQIQARGNVGTESFSVDRVWIANQDETSGVLQAPVTVTQGLAPFSARSDFNTESGAITGDALAVGGTWSGAGDASDFTVAGGIASRTAVSDSADTGRWITASTPTLTHTYVKADNRWENQRTPIGGVIARYTDTSNFLIAQRQRGGSPTQELISVRKRVAGTFTTLFGPVDLGPHDDVWRTIALYVAADGNWALWIGDQGATFGAPYATGFDSALATGGTLASGKVGLYDEHTQSTANTRDFAHFGAFVPLTDAVLFASQSAELSTRGITREDSGGTAYGPVSTVNGDLPRMPNQSSGGTVEFLVKPSRGDLATLPDAGIDDLSVRVYRRKSWLTVSD